MPDRLLTTAYGAVLDQPSRAAAVLRARAVAAGLDLQPASDVDLAAAVLVAHCWAVVNRRTSLGGTLDADQASSLARALVRAAGQGQEPAECAQVGGALEDVPTGQMKEVFPVLQWVLDEVGPQAVRCAVHDLAGTVPQLEALGELMALEHASH